MRSTIALSSFRWPALAVCASRRPTHSSSAARTSYISSASSMLIWRTNTPRFFSRCTRPDSSRARNASRTGPRDTPSRSAIATSLSLAPTARSPARIMRSSSFCTSIGSELDCNSAIVATGGLPADVGLTAILSMLVTEPPGFPSAPLGCLAAPDAFLNVIDAGHEVRDCVDDVMRTALLHAGVGAIALGGLLALRKRLPVLEGEPDFVAADSEAHGPHARVESFLDARDGIVDLHARLDGRDFQVDGILQTHIGIGSPCWHIRRADSRIRFIALPLCVVAIDLHHLAEVTGGRSNLDATLAQFCHHLQRAGNELRVLRKARELKRHELGKHGIHVGVVRRTAVDFLPAAADRVELRDLLDVDLLVRPHRRAGFVHGDGHLFVLVDLPEYHRGRHTAEIHGRAGPIEQYGLDRAAIGTPIAKTHEAVSCYWQLQIVYNIQ